MTYPKDWVVDKNVFLYIKYSNICIQMHIVIITKYKLNPHTLTHIHTHTEFIHINIPILIWMMKSTTSPLCYMLHCTLFRSRSILYYTYCSTARDWSPTQECTYRDIIASTTTTNTKISFTNYVSSLAFCYPSSMLYNI